MLDTIVAHDEYHPGLAAHYLRASDERRQVIAAFFAVACNGNAASNDFATFLARASHQNILRRAFEFVPTGFRRALSKSGSQPHDPSYYTGLYDALALGLRHVVTAIMHMTRLNPERLEIVKALPADLCDCRIIERVRDTQHARDLVTVVDLYEERAARRKSLIDALVASRGSLDAVVRRWCRQIEYGQHPIAECSAYLPVSNGLALHEVARRYQNCSRNYTVQALTGQSAFGEYIAEDGRRVLLCFDRSEGHWTVDGVYARRNRPVPDDLGAQAREFIRTHDIPDRWETNHPNDDVARALGRLIQPFSEW